MNDNILILNYGLGNPLAISNMLEHIDIKHKVDNDPSNIKKYNKIIIPGIGSFDKSINLLNENGIKEALLEACNDNKIILGICLGMQIFFEKSEEGSVPGLSILDGNIVKFKKMSKIKIPHIGWNHLNFKKNHHLKVKNNKFYFLHSYHLDITNKHSIAETNYFYEFPALINYKNIYGVQFHPEKSGKNGMEFFKKFNSL